MKSKVRKLYDDVIAFPENKSLADNITDRLDKVLTQYIDSISKSSERLEIKKTTTVYKELNK